MSPQIIISSPQEIRDLGTFDHPVEIRFPYLARPGAPRAAAAPGGPPPVRADTFGWDTVFAVRIADVNRAIVKAGAYPKAFRFTNKESSLEGTFGPWQLCRGGSGDLVKMAIPITSGTFTYQGEAYPMAGVTAIADVRLHYLDHKPPPGAPAAPGAAPGETTKKLVVRTTPVNPKEPPVAVTELRFTGPEPDDIVQWVVQGALQDCLKAHLSDFSHVFNSVVLNQKLAHDQFAWLAPKYTNYAYTEGPSEEESFLAVLCLTRTDDATGLASQVTHAAVPKEARAGFLIAQSLFMEKMVKPAMPMAFKAQDQDFTLSPDQTKITANRKIKLDPVMHDGKPYYPELEELRIEIVADELRVESQVVVELSPGIYGHMRSTHFSRLKLATKPDGSSTITYEKSREPIVVEPWTTVSPGIEILKIILEVLAVIITAILTILTAGAFLVVALIIVGLVMGLAIAAPTIVAMVLKKDVKDEVPSVDLLAMNSTSPIRWTGAGDFRLTWLGLNGSLQMGGDPSFATA